MTERQELLAQAEELGLSFPKNVTTEALKKSIDKQILTPDVLLESPVVPEGYGEKLETDIRKQLEAEFAARMEEEREKILATLEHNMAADVEKAKTGIAMSGRMKMDERQKASALVRVNVNCKDPMKQEWQGEFFSVSNDAVGDIQKYVMFNTDNGYHIPKIIYNSMRDRECTVFINKRVNGENVKVGKQIKAYSIEVLEPLTQEELEQLGRDQMARQSIDD